MKRTPQMAIRNSDIKRARAAKFELALILVIGLICSVVLN